MPATAAEAEAAPAPSSSPSTCPDRPTYHVAPPSGWVNDPNGLVWCDADGRFHAFYQHAAGSPPTWAWGRLSWGHASTADLAVWRHEGVALTPSPGDHDAAGCWSGCCVPGAEEGGHYTLLYTGVHLRPNLPGGRDPAHSRDAARHPPVPPDADVGLEQHECQLAAVSVGGDGGLRAWRKVTAPPIPHAPPGLGPDLHGFRDPFVFQRWRRLDNGAVQPWRLVLGSGRGGRGCLLSYASEEADPAAPAWRFEGEAAAGRGVVVAPHEVEAGADPPPPSPVDAVDVGEMWECPFIVRLAGEAGGKKAWTLVCVSPYPHTSARGRPTNPPLYWLVAEKEEEEGGAGGEGAAFPPTFDLARAAVGPVRLDLGDALYAPTAAAGAPTTAAGRAAAGWPPGCDGGGHGAAAAASPPAALVMAWLHDLRPAATDADADASASPSARTDYAGCLSVPRIVRVVAGEPGGGGTPRLHQAPAPGLAALRVPPRAPAPPPAPPRAMLLLPGASPVPIPGVAGPAVDLEVTFVRGGPRARAAGLWLRRPRPAAGARGDAPGALAAPTAAALVVDWQGGRLEVVHFTRLTSAGAPDWAAAVRRAGGACAAVRAGRVTLRALCDHSAVEVFADSGEALATRVHGCSADPGRAWELFAVGEDGGGGGTAVPAAAGWAMRGGWEE